MEEDFKQRRAMLRLTRLTRTTFLKMVSEEIRRRQIPRLVLYQQFRGWIVKPLQGGGK